MANKVLVVAAHPDDEVLGCGGTLARHTSEGDYVKVIFVADGVGSRSNVFQQEMRERKQCAYEALAALNINDIVFFDFPDNQLDKIPLLTIVQKIEKVIETYQPNIIYTHHYGDLNIDHSITSKACITACRPLPDSYITHILFFEVVSSTHWGFISESFKPNYYVNIISHIKKKQLALKYYKGEMRVYPHARSIEAIEALAHLRGSTVGLKSAEAFEIFRMIVK